MFLPQLVSQEIDLHLAAILDAILNYAKMLKDATWHLADCQTIYFKLSNESKNKAVDNILRFGKKSNMAAGGHLGFFI